MLKRGPNWVPQENSDPKHTPSCGMNKVHLYGKYVNCVKKTGLCQETHNLIELYYFARKLVATKSILKGTFNQILDVLYV